MAYGNPNVMASKNKRSGNGPYKFPLNSQTEIKQKIVFQAIKIIPPEYEVSLGLTANNTNTALLGTKEFNPIKALPGLEVSKMKVVPLAKERCELYVPIAHNVQEGFQYDQMAMEQRGAITANALQGGLGLSEGLIAGITGGTQSIMDRIQNARSDPAQAARLAFVRGASLATVFGDGPIRQGVNLAFRATMSPNLRTTFKGVAIRDFAYSFKFLPKSPAESAAVQDIIKYFRFHAYPNQIPADAAYAFALEYPNMFRIKLLSGAQGKYKHIGTPIKLCYIRTINHVYNATSQTLHTDGSPTEIDLNLTFTEYKAQTRRDLLMEGNDNFYGYESIDAGMLAAIQKADIASSIDAVPNLPGGP